MSTAGEFGPGSGHAQPFVGVSVDIKKEQRSLIDAAVSLTSMMLMCLVPAELYPVLAKLVQ